MPLNPLRASPGSVRCLLAATAVLLGGCAAPTDSTFPVVVGAAHLKSELLPCADYAAFANYAGSPYYIRNPETGKVVRRHEGMDFCASPGTEVLAAADGQVVAVVEDNPYRGGRVTLRTAIEYADGGRRSTLYVDALHMDPLKGLAVGDVVRAGQVIGHVQPGGKPEVGPRAHVHLSVGPSAWTWHVHTDPNRFWQLGPGIVSCLRADRPPSPQQLVAPLRC